MNVRRIVRLIPLILSGTLALLFPTACGESTTPSGPSQSATTDVPTPAVRPEVRPEGEGPLVVFLGDSISAGLGVAPEEAFPAVLERKLAAAGLPIRVVNAGVSGDTTAGGVSRLDWLLRQKPMLLVVELGANDALRGRAVDQIEADLRRIIDRATERDCPVLLLGMRIPPSYGAEYSGGFASIYERLGHLDGVTLVPFFMNRVAGVPELNLPDGIHPTVRGHELLAETVFPALRRLVVEISE